MYFRLDAGSCALTLRTACDYSPRERRGRGLRVRRFPHLLVVEIAGRRQIAVRVSVSYGL